MEEIAKRFNVGKSSVFRWMVKASIDRRTTQYEKGHTPWTKGRPCSEERRENIRKARLGQPSPSRGIPLSKEHKQKVSQSRMGMVFCQSHKDNLSKSRCGKKHPSKTRERMSKSQKLRYIRDPQLKDRTVAKLYEALKLKPNQVELHLQKILDTYFPKQWKYVGDGGVILNGLIPDFINCNGKKELIELFGDYWHRKEGLRWNYTELGRIMAYNALGFRCLVIWEQELQKLSDIEIADKVREFADAK